MKIFLDSDEIEEIKPVSDSEDNGLVITKENKGGAPTEEEKRTDIVKELIANDTIELGPRESALIHGVSESSAKNYAKGNHISDPEVKTRILDSKHEIENLAITKLMQTLNLLNPEWIDKERDKVAVMTGLSKVIESINGGDKNKTENKMVLHLHMPQMKKEADYEVIEA